MRLPKDVSRRAVDLAFARFCAEENMPLTTAFVWRAFVAGYVMGMRAAVVSSTSTEAVGGDSPRPGEALPASTEERLFGA